MNAFDKHRKGFTAWCQDCSEVFDKFWTANTHRDQKRHNITVTEFWITGKRVEERTYTWTQITFSLSYWAFV